MIISGLWHRSPSLGEHDGVTSAKVRLHVEERGEGKASTCKQSHVSFILLTDRQTGGGVTIRSSSATLAASKLAASEGLY